MAELVPVTMTASTIKGTPVENLQGEDIGHIEDIVIDLQTGHIAYAVLAFGGILGIGDKLFAIPWSSLVIDLDNQKIRMNANKDLLDNAPGFDKDNWPTNPNGQWFERVYSHYNAEPYWKTASHTK